MYRLWKKVFFFEKFNLPNKSPTV